mgnify:CR=1 FL=1
MFSIIPNMIIGNASHEPRLATGTIAVRMASGAWSSALVRGQVREVPIAAAADRVAVRAVDGAAIAAALVPRCRGSMAVLTPRLAVPLLRRDDGTDAAEDSDVTEQLVEEMS